MVRRLQQAHRRLTMRKYAMLALLAILPPVLAAARLTLGDGTVIYGQFVSGNSQNLIFQDDNGVRRRFDPNQVQGIDFTTLNTAAGGYAQRDTRDLRDDRDYRDPRDTR